MIWSMSLSPHWAEVDCDFGTWVVLPRDIPQDVWPDERSWALETADACVADSGLEYRSKRHRRRDVEELAATFLEYQAFMASRGWGHLAFLHLPDLRMAPLLAAVGVWRCEGKREEALRFYSGADDPGTAGEPTVDEFTTEHLGAGLRVLSYFPAVSAPGGPAAVLSYAWRVEEYDTDLCLFVISPTANRLHDAVPDVDALARGIRAVPDPGDDPSEPEEPGFAIDAPSYRLALEQLEGFVDDSPGTAPAQRRSRFASFAKALRR